MFEDYGSQEERRAWALFMAVVVIAMVCIGLTLWYVNYVQ